jgi:outer membrane lipase/esterase
VKLRDIFASSIILLLSTAAQAQTFNQLIGFGDSTLDSGYFRYVNRGNGTEPRYATARANGGSITPSAGLMNTDFLAASFGLSLAPVSAPGGGTNYAVAGARNVAPNSGGGPSPSTVDQINNYLASTGGSANPNALYILRSGANDRASFIAANPNAPPGSFNVFVQPSLATLESSIARLSGAGARYIVLPTYFSGNQALTNYSTQLWNDVAGLGINFIPADSRALRLAVLADPARFGFTSVDPHVLGSPSQPSACHTPNGFNNASAAGYGLYCIPSTTPAGVGPTATAYLNAPNSLQTSLFSDDQHLSPAGQKIEADYIYSLIVAPSQISFLTESAIQFRRGVTLGIQEQIDISQRRMTPGFNVWFNGDISSLTLNNSSAGFPSDPSTPISGTLGATYSFNGNALIGGAVTLGSFDPTFSSGGGFKEQEVAASIFGGVRNGPLWANAIMSFGWLHYDVNRIVPLGITFETNAASTRGQNFSFAALTGYDFRYGPITHGPVVGIEVQSVGIDAFTETGSFTSLGFSNIGRPSSVTALGYRAAVDYGIWRPFAQVTWNHELENTADRMLTATLTSITAPSYSLPIVQLGRDWASAIIGTTIAFGRDWTGLAAFNAQLGQTGAMNYGGRIGVNYAINSPVSPRLITK